MAQTMVNFRMDADLKRELEIVCRDMGMTLTTAFTIFARTVSREKRIPFEVTSLPMNHHADILNIPQITKKVIPIADKYQLGKLYLFGSYARGEADEQSDFDFYLDSSFKGGLFRFSALSGDLEAALGKPVDIITKDGLLRGNCDEFDNEMKNAIERDKVLIYEGQQQS